MKKPKLNIGILIVLAIFSVACADVYLPINSRNYAHMYNPMFTDLHPTTLLHRIRKDSSVLFVRVPVSDIEFPEFRRRSDQVAGIEATVYLVDSAGANVFRDSITKLHWFPAKPATYYLQFQMAFKHHPDSIRFVELCLKDIISNAETSEIIPLLDDSRHNPQRYYMYYNDKKYPFTHKFIKQTDSVKIHTSVAIESLYAFHLTQNTHDSLPFDTVYRVPTNKFIKFSQPGAYVLNADSTTIGGQQLLVESKYFPAIKTAEQMLPPIKLLTNTKEWQWLNQFDKKIAVDTFWLKSAPNAEQARKQIQVFYNRMQHANIKFTTQRPGWQTQPGKIILLAGLPNETVWTDDGQIWYYFIGKNEKLKIPFKHNIINQELELQRNDSVLNGFLLHYIDCWRNGIY